MKKLFSLKMFRKGTYDDDDNMEAEDEYVELNTNSDHASSSRIIVRPFVLDDFNDIKKVVDVLREGYTICLLNIGPLREKDMIELKRAINKLKKTIEAVGGDIAGFGEDYIVVVPSFAEIYRSSGNTEEIDE